MRTSERWSESSRWLWRRRWRQRGNFGAYKLNIENNLKIKKKKKRWLWWGVGNGRNKRSLSLSLEHLPTNCILNFTPLSPFLHFLSCSFNVCDTLLWYSIIVHLFSFACVLGGEQIQEISNSEIFSYYHINFFFLTLLLFVILVFFLLTFKFINLIYESFIIKIHNFNI